MGSGKGLEILAVKMDELVVEVEVCFFFSFFLPPLQFSLAYFHICST